MLLAGVPVSDSQKFYKNVCNKVDFAITIKYIANHKIKKKKIVKVYS